MKRVMAGLLVMGLLVCGAFAQVPEKRATFSLNLGMQTNLWRGSSFDLTLGTLDMRVGFRLGSRFEISPELMYVTSHKFHVDYGYFYPGVVFNFVAKNFFIGAGVVLPIFYGGGDTDSGNPAPKANIGIIYNRLMLTAYIIMYTENSDYWGFPHFNYIGATVGYRF